MLEAGDPVKLYELEKEANPLPNGKGKEKMDSEKECFKTLTYLFTTASQSSPDLAKNAFEQIFPFVIYDLETKLDSDKTAEREAILKFLSHLLSHIPSDVRRYANLVGRALTDVLPHRLYPKMKQSLKDSQR